MKLKTMKILNEVAKFISSVMIVFSLISFPTFTILWQRIILSILFMSGLEIWYETKRNRENYENWT